MNSRLPAVAWLWFPLAFATFVSVSEAAGQQAPASPAAPPASLAASDAPDASSASGSVSVDRIRAGLQRSTFLAGERAKDDTPTFRTEVTGHVIKLRNYWSERDPDMEPDPFTYPIPSAAELLIGYGILKPRAALRARKHRALQEQIQREIEQIEQQRDATAPPAPATSSPASPSGARP
jgi:hypothetical protein